MDKWSYYKKYLEELKSQGFKFCGRGSSRIVFHKDNIVIKIPNNNLGIFDNLVEHTAYQKYKRKRTNRGYLLAPCKLLSNGCLQMSYVEDKFGSSYLFRKNYKWINSLQDGDQVGFYKGELVLYDYAWEVSERFNKIIIPKDLKSLIDFDYKTLLNINNISQYAGVRLVSNQYEKD